MGRLNDCTSWDRTVCLNKTLDGTPCLLILQASAGIGYANVKMMQYDVKNYGEKKMMDVAEIVK